MGLAVPHNQEGSARIWSWTLGVCEEDMVAVEGKGRIDMSVKWQTHLSCHPRDQRDFGKSHFSATHFCGPAHNYSGGFHFPTIIIAHVLLSNFTSFTWRMLSISKREGVLKYSIYSLIAQQHSVCTCLHFPLSLLIASSFLSSVLPWSEEYVHLFPFPFITLLTCHVVNLIWRPSRSSYSNRVDMKSLRPKSAKSSSSVSAWLDWL